MWNIYAFSSLFEYYVGKSSDLKKVKLGGHVLKPLTVLNPLTPNKY